jgi:chromosome segregation ATPase
VEHNEKINRLLEQVEIIKESEEKNLEIQRSNDELNNQLADLRFKLEEKESEITQVKQKENISKEMSSMLDSAYGEFNVLQGKILKLESQLSATKMSSIEYEDLKESYYKMTRDLNESKSKLSHYMQENHNLQIQLNRTEDKLSEANLQRQQLQKKVAYLEELTSDLQQMSEANKKLEGQMKKIGELESMLNMIAEERDQLKEKQQNEF